MVGNPPACSEIVDHPSLCVQIRTQQMTRIEAGLEDTLPIGSLERELYGVLLLVFRNIRSAV